MRVAIAIVIATFTLALASHPLPAQPRDNVLALQSIHMIDSMTGWAVAKQQDTRPGSPSGALLRTTNGGTQWTDVTPTYMTYGLKQNRFHLDATNVDVFTSRFAWVGSFRTVDGGRSWELTTAPLIRSIYFINARDGWLLSFEGANSATVETHVYRSANRGETWRKVASASVASSDELPDIVGGDPRITFLNATTGWITQSHPRYLSEWSYLYATRDGGRTWSHRKLPLPPQRAPSWTGMMAPRFFTKRDGILPVFYADNDRLSHRAIVPFVLIYATRDGGKTWKYTTPISVTQWGALSFADINHGWLADGNVLYTTSDGGRQWKAIRHRAFTDVNQLDFISPRLGWAVRRTRPFLTKTLDGGRTWSPVVYIIKPK